MRKFLALVLFLVIISSLVIYGNYAVETENISVKLANLPTAFNGLKILQISDLHNDKVLCNTSILYTEINKIECDYIFFTGDLVDDEKVDLSNVDLFLSKIKNKAQKILVYGNHENAISDKQKLVEILTKYNIKVLHNDTVTLTKDTQTINIVGIDDPILFDDYYGDNVKFEEKLNNLIDKNKFNILLSHRAEYMDKYKKANVDLVFSGHAHGGQVRVFNKGLYSPGQGLLPKYSSGLYIEDNTNMVVSRGLGNSQVPIRLFNKPHLILVELISTLT